MTARLVEIMESIQGEGLLVGSRNIFMRFCGCNLHCSYCDTPTSREMVPYCQIIKTPGTSELCERLPNPLSMSQVLEAVSHYRARWISLTGGEPLLWADLIAALGSRIQPLGYQFLLETNGTLCEELQKCLPYIDLISMDYKLSAATGEDNQLRHYQFLTLAAHKPVYVKVVIDAQVERDEIQTAVRTIVAVRPDIPLVLQPVTPHGEAAAPDMEMLLDLQKMCLQDLKDVRIIPQIHKFMGLI
ncbi:MAG: 7-carboxy-7-deazaguanine synthase QueE [Firmicutes bacterium]|nr:7-carboxy-7-deazaguanine synthase QueE [Bacillota bacterium]